jgi:hypothetical protein
MNPLLRDELVAILKDTQPPAMPADLQFPQVDVSERAQKMREILHIANAYSWQTAIVHFLSSRGCAYLSDLTAPQLDDLLDRMRGYVDAAETGCSLAESLPAN